MPGYQNVSRTAYVERQRLKFAAAHMATFAGTIEPLHGHNYAVIIKVEGELAAEGWVADFGLLKWIGRDICDRLDHHFLLQSRSTLLAIRRAADSWEISFAEKRYCFPAADVFELPIANTTAEQLAEWFWLEVFHGLQSEGVANVRRLTIGVEEAPGQVGWFGADVSGD